MQHKVCYNIYIKRFKNKFYCAIIFVWLRSVNLISSILAMQNLVLSNNMAVSSMMSASDRMLNSVSFGNSQPLKPHFSHSLTSDELNIKANETKAAVTQHLLNAFSKKTANNIKRSAPKFAGLDYKA